MNLYDKLDKKIQNFIDSPALLFDENQLSYKDLQNLVNELGENLNSNFEKKQIGILLKNSPAFLAAFLAITKLNRVSAILNPDWQQNQLLEVLETYQIGQLICHEEFFINYPLLKERYKVLKNVNGLLFMESSIFNNSTIFTSESSPLFIGFTSGTTTMPKGFIQTHQSWVKSMKESAEILETKTSSTVIAPGPLHHGLTFYAAVEGLIAGANVVIMEKRDLDKLTSYFLSHKNITLVVVPTILSLLIDFCQEASLKFDNVKKIITAGAKLTAEVAEQAQRLFPFAQIFEYYGASELGFVTLKKEWTHEHEASVGQAFPGVELSIRASNHKIVAPTEIGTIWVKSPYLSLGYLQNLDHSGFSKINEWATVGDYGYLTADGHLYLMGRENDMIITGGLNVYPSEVEFALKNIKQIKDAYVVGITDDHWGHKVIALISWNEDMKISKNELKTICKQFMSAYKCPKQFFEIDEFPLTHTGKIARAGLKENIINKLYKEIH